MKTIKCKMRRTVKTTAAAFTLFELLIVLAVVVILSAVAYPTIRSIVGSEYLTSGGDQVRIHFAQARNQAIRSGQTLSLRYEIAGKRYLIEPWTTGDEFLEAGMTSDTQPQVNLMGMGAVEVEPNPNHVIEKLVGQIHTLQRTSLCRLSPVFRCTPVHSGRCQLQRANRGCRPSKCH